MGHPRRNRSERFNEIVERIRSSVTDLAALMEVSSVLPGYTVTEFTVGDIRVSLRKPNNQPSRRLRQRDSKVPL